MGANGELHRECEFHQLYILYVAKSTADGLTGYGCRARSPMFRRKPHCRMFCDLEVPRPLAAFDLTHAIPTVDLRSARERRDSPGRDDPRGQRGTLHAMVLDVFHPSLSPGGSIWNSN